MTKRTDITIRNIETGEVKSLRKFAIDNKKEITQKCFLFSHIVSKKILSKAELEKLILSGDFKEVIYNNKRYIDKVELFNFLNKK